MTKTILKNLLKKHSTRLYPEEQRILPDGFHGRIQFVPDKCILCRLCVIKCPTKIIHIDAEAGLWEREVMGCLYCAVCAEACPTGCIIMTNIHRPPILEPVVQRFHVTPRPAKKKEQAAQEGEIKVALEAKAVEQALTDDHKAKKETTEEESAVPIAKAKAEKASAKKKDKK